ncbi:MAG TPA: DUF4349 domain-containing protein [Longimicrobium sp.]|nr:DUF4349 domain-containing protein [Longimicrobium sp.]
MRRARRLLVPSLLLLAAACASASAPPPPRSSPQTAQTPQGRASQERLLARRGSMRVVVERPDTAAARAVRIVEGAGGYVDASTADENSRVQLWARVPAATLDGVMEAFGGLGEVEERHIRTVDVTDETIDLEARLRNQTAVRDRLRSYLQQAGAVADVIAVERELARVQAEVEALEARLARMRSEVALSAVDLRLDRRRVLGPLGQVLSSVAWLVEKLFVIR